jgi:AmmeMemoRadiSam system protein B/AmmeMemoRadiSam system protein A
LTLKARRAGSWYPGSATRVKDSLAEYLQAVPDAPLPQVAAIIGPHAGWSYSGPTAAYAYKAVFRNHYDRVILLGPSHHVALGARAVLTDAEAWTTPLGDARLDRDAARALARDARFLVDDRVVEGEHSLEMHVPFLQAALPDAPILPIVLGTLDPAAVREVALALRALVTNQTLVVVSSDFTHYGPNYDYQPFTENPAENLKKLDFEAASYIEKRDPDGFLAFRQRTSDTICGWVPIAVLLAMLPDTGRGRVLHYDTSGAATGDYTNSVSYFALVFEGKWQPGDADFSWDSWPLARLDPERKQTLLKLARQSAETYVRTGKVLDPQEAGFDVDDLLRTRAGAFVTLKKNGVLRGCIGEIPPRRPLVQVVVEHAIDAAANDPRFPAVQPSELAELEVEVSVLTPPHPIPGWRDIRVGTDGVVLSKAGRSAVFLPQVATEEGWGSEQLLNHLARKAGLPVDAWREGAAFLVFQAVVFAERDFKAAGTGAAVR